MIDVVREVVHVMTPTTSVVVAQGGSVSPLAFPDLVLEVAAILL